MHHASKKAVFAALFGNLGIAVFKLTAALLSRSSSMMAEGYHSLSDTFNQILLLYGLKKSRKKPDREHPFGYGKEQYFWSFMVAVLLFGVAGTLSIRQGLHKLSHPESLSHIGLMYLAIVVGLTFDGYALSIAVRAILKQKKETGCHSFFAAVRNSKDPTTLTVFFEDLLALIGLLIVASAIFLVQVTGNLVYDALASIIIGALLMIFSLLLAYETKGLLLGESVTENIRLKILALVRSFKGVNRIISLKTMHLGAEEVLVTLEINYSDGMIVDDLEKLNDRIEAEIIKIIPQAKVYLEPESL